MTSSICIINAHPDPSPERLVRALCDAYEDGARSSGHAVQRINVGELDFPILTRPSDFSEPPPEPVLSEREKILNADHIVLAFPLWLGSLPAKSRAFLEQVACASFFLDETDTSGWPKKLMKGKSVRIVVTMGMPGIVFETLMDGGAVKALERGLFGMSGFKPIRHTIFGLVGAGDHQKYSKWLAKMRSLGAKAA